MKKKFLQVLVGLIAITAIPAFSQTIFSSDFETWIGNLPFNWGGVKTNIDTNTAVSQYTTNVHGGTYACKLENTSTSHKRFTTKPLSITTQTTYSITFWVRGQGEIRTGLYNGGPGSSGDYFYNNYIVVNSTSWTQQTQTVTADTTSATAEFIISIKSTNAANDHLQIDDVEITTTTVNTVTIYDIQYTTSPSGDSPLDGQDMITSGIVTAFYSNGYFIQDAKGAWNGVYVYDNSNQVNIGDSITIKGEVQEYYNLTEITNVASFTLNSSGNTLPEADTVTTTDVNSEAYEGVLVYLMNATCTNPNAGFGTWVVQDQEGTCKINDLIFAYTPTLNKVYNIKGVVYYSFGEFTLEPRNVPDINEVITGIGQYLSPQNDFNIYPLPVNNYFSLSNIDMIKEISILNLIGKVVKTHIPSVAPEEKIDIGSLSSGIYMVRIQTHEGATFVKKITKR